MGDIQTLAAHSRRNLLLGGAAGALGLTLGNQGASAAPAATDPVHPLKLHGVNNILEFGDSSMSDEERLKAAMSYWVGMRQEVTLTISRGFVLTDTVTVDTSYITLDFTTGNLDARTLIDRPAFLLTASSSSGYANNRVSIRGLRVLGPGSEYAESIGILFDTAKGAVRGVGLYDLEVSGFGTGLEFGNNAFLLSFYNFHVYRCGTAISLPAGRTNAGENIKFIGGGLGTSRLGIFNGNPNGNLHFFATSIDFCVAAARADAGGIFLHQPHIEFNETGAASIAPHFVTGTSTSAKIVITGGHLFFHAPPTAPYLFETNNEHWGGGISLSQLSMFNTSTTSGFLCGGSGRLKTRDILQYDGNGTGSGNGALMTARASNKLIDGSFDLATPVDPFVNTADATSRTASPSLALQNAAGQLVVTRQSVGTNVSVAIDVPCTAGLTYASLFKIASTTSAGTLGVIESFIAVSGSDSRAIPLVVKSDARGQSNISMTTVAQNLPYTRINGPTSWNRVAPPWATHFRLRLMFSAVKAGATVFDEIVITEL